MKSNGWKLFDLETVSETEQPQVDLPLATSHGLHIGIDREGRLVACEAAVKKVQLKASRYVIEPSDGFVRYVVDMWAAFHAHDKKARHMMLEELTRLLIRNA